MTHEELLAKRDALVSARSEGTLRVIFVSGGTRREIEYRSVKDIQAAIDALDRDLAANQGTRITTFYPHFSKGFE